MYKTQYADLWCLALEVAHQLSSDLSLKLEAANAVAENLDLFGQGAQHVPSCAHIMGQVCFRKKTP